MMTTGVLNNSETCDRIVVSATDWIILLERVKRLEDVILKRRELAVIEFSSIEDAYQISRTKEKRVR